MKQILSVLLLILLCCRCAPDNKNIDLPDLSKIGSICDSLVSSGLHAQAANLYFKTGQDLGNSELYVYAAWQYGAANMNDSAVISINHAINKGMSNPHVLEAYHLTTLKNTSIGEGIEKRLDSIKQALSRVEKFAIVTEPFYSFWPYFRSALADTINGKKYLEEYIRNGSLATKDYYHKRYENLENMFMQMIRKTPGHYRYTEQFLDKDKIESLTRTMKRMMHRLSEVYPPAVFPKVYLVPGILSGNGTETELGLFMAAEMFVKSPAMAREGLTKWQLEAIDSPQNMVFVTIHELMHFQQAYSDEENRTNLLGKVITEGACDFFADLLSDNIKTLDSARISNITYLDNSENLRFVLSEFKKEMYSKDLSKWMYNGGAINDRPSDMGYALGYKICKSYYDRSTDKRNAIIHLLTTNNFKDILAGSDYAFVLL